MELLAFVVLVLGLVGSSILRRHLVLAKRLKLRQVLHEERMKAMERNVELPEAEDPELARLLGGSQTQGPNGRSWLSSSLLWVRLVSLCLGLTGLFGGIGTCIGLAMTTGDKMYEFWPMGLIPAFVGAGLLIFYAMSEKLTALARDEAVSSAG
jgi:uncharacterized membrane protein YeaQ/YmgE (transglycosylase-associated protein family)